MVSRVPTVKHLIKRGWSKDIAEKIRKILIETGSLRDVDRVINGFGVEVIGRGKNKKSPMITYVNMGDPYAETIMRINGHYYSGDWGTIVEMGNYD